LQRRPGRHDGDIASAELDRLCRLAEHQRQPSLEDEEDLLLDLLPVADAFRVRRKTPEVRALLRHPV
jgi:hypothetical protein